MPKGRGFTAHLIIVFRFPLQKLLIQIFFVITLDKRLRQFVPYGFFDLPKFCLYSAPWVILLITTSTTAVTAKNATPPSDIFKGKLIEITVKWQFEL